METEQQTRAIVQQFARLYRLYCEQHENLTPYQSKTIKQFLEWSIEIQMGPRWVEHFAEIVD